MIDRELGKKALFTVLSQKQNVNIIEKNIYDLSKKTGINYITIIYECIGNIIQKIPLKEVLENIKKKKIMWNNPVFTDISLRIKEQNDFIKNPFEVEEGVFQCKICGSRRVYSYSRQDRSCDEGTSVYAQCVACKVQWRERG
tara:strand:+ start:988 stop:1413 length:426 start_codon:yes stop_codon:yes gene_type:complete